MSSHSHTVCVSVMRSVMCPLVITHSHAEGLTLHAVSWKAAQLASGQQQAKCMNRNSFFRQLLSVEKNVERCECKAVMALNNVL